MAEERGLQSDRGIMALAYQPLVQPHDGAPLFCAARLEAAGLTQSFLGVFRNLAFEAQTE